MSSRGSARLPPDASEPHRIGYSENPTENTPENNPEEITMTTPNPDNIRDEIEGSINVQAEFGENDELRLTLSGHKDLVGSLLSEQARADIAAGLNAQNAAKNP